MPSILPNECLQEIFATINVTDFSTLYSVILVNRTWCENAITFLWKAPFRSDPKTTNIDKIVPIFLSFLKYDIKIDLRINSFKLPTKLAFYYPSFLRHLDLNNLIIAVTQWLHANPPLNEMTLFYHKRTKKEIVIEDDQRNDFVIAILNVIITSSERIDDLQINMKDKIDLNMQNFFKNDLKKFFATPETQKCLSKLERFDCSGQIPISDILLELSNYAHNIMTLSFHQSNIDESNDVKHKELSALIKVQQNLQYTHFEWLKNEGDISSVILALSSNINSLKSFEMVNGVVNNIALELLSKCSNIETLHFRGQPFMSRHMAIFCDAMFPKLNSLQFINMERRRDRTEDTNPFARMIQNIGINSSLRSLCICDKANHHSSLLDAVSQISQNLTSFTTHLTESTEKSFILSILRNATRLEILNILQFNLINTFYIEDDGFLSEMAKVVPVTLRHLDISQLEFSIESLGEFLTNCGVKFVSLIYNSVYYKNSQEDYIRKLADENQWIVKKFRAKDETNHTKIFIEWG
ncbi:7332_t:CDS:1 [Cetraspora pellucida]|uniref:7332_t:CDS:1 n=1 Tax=Cetraspora pellucida TaxID=1433469 RepID=A0ACA9KEZ5_9GLOM|nr:7332_t:CDS:1 [Cetraspora pellucida]